MEIVNKTAKPLSIPLPGGKKLFLGPKKSGQVKVSALEFAPVMKLIESGEIETLGSATKSNKAVGVSSPISRGSRNGGTGAMRQSGDR